MYAQDLVPGNNPNAPKDMVNVLTGADSGTGILGKSLFFGTKDDPRQLARDIIFVVFGFLGTLMIVLILYSGFLWMMARKEGEKDKILSARGHLTNAIIGAIIVMSAWTISIFVLEALKQTVQESPDGGGAGGGGNIRMTKSVPEICDNACADATNGADKWQGCKVTCLGTCRDAKYFDGCTCHAEFNALGLLTGSGCVGKVQ